MVDKLLPKIKEIRDYQSYLDNKKYLSPACSFEDSTYDNFKSH